jgi:hypothetical protein
LTSRSLAVTVASVAPAPQMMKPEASLDQRPHFALAVNFHP